MPHLKAQDSQKTSVSFLKKLPYLVAAKLSLEARAFLQNTGELSGSQVNHVLDSFCVFFLRSG
jgi:hypothetical protein